MGSLRQVVTDIVQSSATHQIWYLLSVCVEIVAVRAVLPSPATTTTMTGSGRLAVFVSGPLRSHCTKTMPALV
jgi:hypothetical protein